MDGLSSEKSKHSFQPIWNAGGIHGCNLQLARSPSKILNKTLQQIEIFQQEQQQNTNMIYPIFW